MRQIQTWTGREWIHTPIEKLPLGNVAIRVIEVEHPVLDLDILTPLKGYFENGKATRKPDILRIVRRDGRDSQ